MPGCQIERKLAERSSAGLTCPHLLMERITRAPSTVSSQHDALGAAWNGLLMTLPNHTERDLEPPVSQISL